MGMTEEQLRALEALESMDDFARMDAGVDPIGPYKVLREFIEAPIAPPASDYDLSAVITLMHNKTESIIERGYKITGFVLTDDAGRKRISDMSAIRWFNDPAKFFRMMHPDSDQVASEQKPVDPWMNTNGAFLNMKRTEQDALHGEAMDKLTEMVRAAQSNQPDYKAQRDALLDFANHIATAPQLSGTGWQEMAQMVVASAKGGE